MLSTAHPSPHIASLYRTTLERAAVDSAALMGKLVQATRAVLGTREAAARDLRERDAIGVAVVHAHHQLGEIGFEVRPLAERAERARRRVQRRRRR
mgnify:CR=1 FL=1